MTENIVQIDEERTNWWEEIKPKLADPFPADMVYWKPQKTWNPDDWGDKNTRNHTKALAVAYIDARLVADRLDAVFSPGGWQLNHRQEGGQLLTGLGIYDPFIEQWLWKWDVGHINGTNNDQGQITKGTLSDGLKRAAVLWGIGRYLYFLPKTSVPYDPLRRKLVQYPELPQWALPEGTGRP
ncbi:Rad52/Rad22 family DNA repair protein [Chloroflexota bacterium]